MRRGFRRSSSKRRGYKRRSFKRRSISRGKRLARYKASRGGIRL